MTACFSFQLIDIQWKVGVAMSSDQCKNLNSPFVTLTLTVSDPAGNLKTHTLELTMEQFRVFHLCIIFACVFVVLF